MPRKKSLAIPIHKRTGVSLAPPNGNIARFKHPLLEKKSITRRGLQRYNENILALFAPEILPHAMEQIRQGVIKGDKDMIDKAARIYELLRGGGGVTINNMNNNSNSASAQAAASGGKGFDAIIRQLSANDKAMDAEFTTDDAAR
jgi:hypothetical protein